VIAVGGAVLLSFTNSMGSSKETSSGGGLGGHKNWIIGPVLLFSFFRSLVIMAHRATEAP